MLAAPPSQLARWGALGLAAAVFGCSDGPAAPPMPSATAMSLEIQAGDGQTAAPGHAVALAPAVRVLDGSGKPLSGVTVRFEVVAGGGEVEHGSADTDSRGIASAGVWTLGGAKGANTMDATVDGLDPLRFTATAESPFSIAVRYVGPATARQRLAVDRAIERWTTAVVTELTDIPLTSAAGECFETQPAVDELIDDLLILVRFEDIDGEAGTLGKAGPCYIRTGSSLPIMGLLVLDNADLAKLETVGLLDDVVLHEVGHVLGIGSLWQQLGLVSGVGGSDPRFTGAHASAAYTLLDPAGGTVPVEGTGGAGTRDSHWRETTFKTELMTGFLGSAPNPLSAMTVASLKDLGYGTNAFAASDYALPAAGALPPVQFGELDETVVRPKYSVDQQGNRREIFHTSNGSR